MADKVEKRILTLYSDVQATSVHWLWYPFIAVGKITLLQGDPGDGKSTMMMNLIAELSKGGKTPDGKPVGTPQRVIYQCSEDGVYLIKKLLSDGDMRAREIYMRMKDEGISRRTAENTKKELGIRSYRKMRQWYWSIHTGE